MPTFEKAFLNVAKPKDYQFLRLDEISPSPGFGVSRSSSISSSESFPEILYRPYVIKNDENNKGLYRIGASSMSRIRRLLSTRAAIIAWGEKQVKKFDFELSGQEGQKEQELYDIGKRHMSWFQRKITKKDNIIHHGETLVNLYRGKHVPLKKGSAWQVRVIKNDGAIVKIKMINTNLLALQTLITKVGYEEGILPELREVQKEGAKLRYSESPSKRIIKHSPQQKAQASAVLNTALQVFPDRVKNNKALFSKGMPQQLPKMALAKKTLESQLNFKEYYARIRNLTDRYPLIPINVLKRAAAEKSLFDHNMHCDPKKMDQKISELNTERSEVIQHVMSLIDKMYPLIDKTHSDKTISIKELPESWQEDIYMLMEEKGIHDPEQMRALSQLILQRLNDIKNQIGFKEMALSDFVTDLKSRFSALSIIPFSDPINKFSINSQVKSENRNIQQRDELEEQKLISILKNPNNKGKKKAKKKVHFDDDLETSHQKNKENMHSNKVRSSQHPVAPTILPVNKKGKEDFNTRTYTRQEKKKWIAE